MTFNRFRREASVKNVSSLDGSYQTRSKRLLESAFHVCILRRVSPCKFKNVLYEIFISFLKDKTKMKGNIIL